MTRSEQEIDHDIVAAIQAGDRSAFAHLYDRHAAWLLAVAYRILGNRRDAEDLLHDVFIEVWDKARGYDPQRGSVRSWLAIRTRSRALDRIRSLKLIRNHEAVEIDHLAPAGNDSAGTETGVDHRTARRVVDALPDKQRTVIQLSYFQGLTCQEIAERCEIPLGTVKSRLASALNTLRDSLKPAEGNPR
ncbi:MAG: sigma-70 family RNA polymerase sigma factor [Gammaproteobacteria bacterium]